MHGSAKRKKGMEMFTMPGDEASDRIHFLVERTENQEKRLKSMVQHLPRSKQNGADADDKTYICAGATEA